MAEHDMQVKVAETDTSMVTDHFGVGIVDGTQDDGTVLARVGLAFVYEEQTEPTVVALMAPETAEALATALRRHAAKARKRSVT